MSGPPQQTPVPPPQPPNYGTQPTPTPAPPAAPAASAAAGSSGASTSMSNQNLNQIVGHFPLASVVSFGLGSTCFVVFMSSVLGYNESRPSSMTSENSRQPAEQHGRQPPQHILHQSYTQYRSFFITLHDSPQSCTLENNCLTASSQS
jgi:hypothetical protein